MKSWRALWMLGLSMTGAGCTIVEDSNRNVFVALWTPIEVHRQYARNEKSADAASTTVAASTEDFSRGFKDGFVDYLVRRGDTEAAPVVPQCYRQPGYQNAQGSRAVQEWFAGYRSGATAARESGARKWIAGAPPASTGLHEASLREGAIVVANLRADTHTEGASSPALKEDAQATDLPPRLGVAMVDLDAPFEERPLPAEESRLKATVKAVNIAAPTVPEPPALPIPRIEEAPEVAPAPTIEEMRNQDALRARIQRIMSGPAKD